MSDFIEFVDEVIDGEPEYNVTQKPNGKYDIELANNIITAGTEINKLCLDPINNAIGYATLDYTLETMPDSNLIFNNGTYVNNDIVNNNFNIPIIVHNPYNNYGVIANGTETIQVYNAGLTSSQYDKWLEIPNNVYSFEVYMESSKWLYATNAENPTFNDWTMILNGNNVTTGYHTVINNYKHYMLYASSKNYSNWRNFLVKDGKKANYSLARKPILNNTILNVYIPSIEENIINNTMNNKQLDTLLQNNKYYELLYDQPNDRFIAYEKRV